MNSITVTVPIPPTGCNPNSREHWRRRAADIADARECSCFAGMSAVGANRNWKRWQMPWNEVSLLIRWFHPTKNHRDPDNIIAALKASIDGLKDAGILHDDNRITYLPAERLTDKANPRVELILTRNEP